MDRTGLAGILCLFGCCGVFCGNVFSEHAGIVVQFRDGEFISYDLRPQWIEVVRNDITFWFKTFHPSGLLLFASGTQGDFVLLELKDGRFKYVHYISLYLLCLQQRLSTYCFLDP